DYGEISSSLADLVELVNDPAVRRRAIECARARTVFRQFHWDKDGYRGLRTEGVIGTRHNNYPGRLRYGKRPLFVAATFQEPVTLRIAQLYLKHNRAFDEYEGRKTPLKRVMAVNAYREIADRPPSDYRLPTRPGQGDFLLTDEQVNAVAVRHDYRTLYAVLNWHNQKSGGINNIARIHYTTPRVDRIANVRMKTKYRASGEYYTKRDVVGIDHPHNPQHAKNPDSYRLPWGTTEAHRVLAGMKLPIATGPGGQSLSDRDPRKMTGTFLRLRYGDYLIGMNRTRGEHGKSYTIQVPKDVPRAKDLASGETYGSGATVEVSPDSTAVLDLGD
ncbi:MAG: hypothetical protein V5A84_04600, partial [Planctomycetota bacterium]